MSALGSGPIVFSSSSVKFILKNPDSGASLSTAGLAFLSHAEFIAGSLRAKVLSGNVEPKSLVGGFHTVCGPDAKVRELLA